MKRKPKRKDLTRQQFKNEIESLWNNLGITNYEFYKFDIEDNRVVKNTDKFQILCKTHNYIFSRNAKTLLKGSKHCCDKCNREDLSNSRILSKTEVKERLIKVYGKNSQYDLDETLKSFTTTKGKIDVICRIHGKYTTTMSDFLRGGGCRKCSAEKRTKTRDQFIRDSIDKWGSDRWGYDRLVMPSDGMFGYVELFCNIHKIYYKQKASNHLYGWNGCPSCKESSMGERLVEKYLKEHKIKYDRSSWIELDSVARITNKVEIDFKVYIPSRKEIWIEVNGVQHYQFEPFLHSGKYQNLINQVNRDNAVRKYSKENNIDLLEIPYPDLDRIPEILDAFFGPNHQDITTHLDPVLLPVPLYYYYYGQNKTIEAKGSSIP